MLYFIKFAQVKEDWNPSCLDLLLGRIEQPQEQTKDKKLTSPSIGFWQLLALNKPEWHLVVTGVLAAGVVGATQPTLAIVFSRMLEVRLLVCQSVRLLVCQGYNKSL